VKMMSSGRRRTMRAVALIGAHTSLVVACNGSESLSGRVGFCSEEVYSSTWMPESLPDGFDPSGGIAASASAVVAFDREAGSIAVLSEEFGTGETFGRIGDGPGEIARPGAGTLVSARSSDWVDVAGEEVYVLDGRTVQVFATDGKLMKYWSILPLGFGFGSKLRHDAGSVLLDKKSRFPLRSDSNPESAGGSFTIFRSGASNIDTLVALALSPLPVSARGAIFEGPREARPSWDSRNSCLVVSDGYSDSVLVMNLRTRQKRHVRVAAILNAVEGVPPVDERLDDLGEVGAPAPSRPALVSAVFLGGDGWLWIRPAANAAALEGRQVVVRHHLKTGRSIIDTVWAFPRFLGSDGIPYAARADEGGRVGLKRVD
jgi:hypothetical protein